MCDFVVVDSLLVGECLFQYIEYPQQLHGDILDVSTDAEVGEGLVQSVQQQQRVHIVKEQRNHEVLVGSVAFGFLFQGLDNLFYLIAKEVLHQFGVSEDVEHIRILGL